MSLRNPLPPWTRRDNFSPSAHQRQNDAINAVASLFGDGTIGVAGTPFGRTLIDGRITEIAGLLFGEIVTTGPIGDEEDFKASDNRYWVKLKRTAVTHRNRDDDVDEDAYPRTSFQKVELEDDLAPPGDHTQYVTTPSTTPPEPPLIIVASDVGFGPGGRMSGMVIVIECFALTTSESGEQGREKVYVIFREMPETMWVRLTDYDPNPPGTKYAWEQVMAKQSSDAESLGDTAVSGSGYIGGLTGTLDDDYAIDIQLYSSFPDPSFSANMASGYRRPQVGDIVLLRRIKRETWWELDEEDESEEPRQLDKTVWGIVRLPGEGDQVVEVLSYDETTQTYAGHYSSNNFTPYSSSNPRFSEPPDSADVDFNDGRATAGGSNDCIVINLIEDGLAPDDGGGITSGTYCNATLRFWTADGIRVYTIDRGWKTYVSGVVSVDFGAEVLTIKDVAVLTWAPDGDPVDIP